MADLLNWRHSPTPLDANSGEPPNPMLSPFAGGMREVGSRSPCLFRWSTRMLPDKDEMIDAMIRLDAAVRPRAAVLP
jgi:hypothetical protein